MTTKTNWARSLRPSALSAATAGTTPAAAAAAPRASAGGTRCLGSLPAERSLTSDSIDPERTLLGVRQLANRIEEATQIRLRHERRLDACIFRGARQHPYSSSPASPSGCYRFAREERTGIRTNSDRRRSLGVTPAQQLRTVLQSDVGRRQQRLNLKRRILRLLRPLR